MNDYPSINHPDQVPKHVSDDTSADYWDSHELTDEFIENARALDVNEMPAKRTKAQTITLRIDQDTLERLNALADKKNKGYQTLLKQFIIERLYEEEKRDRQS